MFVINPDPYSLPCYRIGPFQTKDLSINHYLKDSDLIDEYFNSRFSDKDYIYTINGREAIHYALTYYQLKRDDVVTVLTTSNNFYISGCVTNEIEKYCRWSREILPDTKLIFVNHEFGYPFKNLKELKNKYNLPIIEDCAGSFFSEDDKNEIGNVGDFVIYSFPKMFPLQIGGLLVSNISDGISKDKELQGLTLRHIKNVLSKYITVKDQIIKVRLSNYKYLRSRFSELNLPERFDLKAGVIPGVFMFKTKDHKIELPELKKFYYSHGVQCSVFYGEEAFFIPVHQSLSEADLDYFFEICKTFISKF